MKLLMGLYPVSEGNIIAGGKENFYKGKHYVYRLICGIIISWFTQSRKQRQKGTGERMNPTSIMKLMSAKNQFTHNHPKFAAFVRAAFLGGIEAGTIIEISVTKPGQETMTSNIKVQETDLELLHELREFSQGGV